MLHYVSLESRLFSSIDVQLYAQNGKVAFLGHLLIHLGVTHTIHVELIKKPLINFLLSFTAEGLQAKIF